MLIKQKKQFEFVTNSFVTIGTIISLSLLVGGYLYNFLIFYYFDLKIIDFFSTTDYIASSLDVIGTTLFSSIAFTLSFIFSYYMTPKLEKNSEVSISNDKEIQKIKNNSKKRQLKFYVLLLIGVVIYICFSDLSLKSLQFITLIIFMIVSNIVLVFKTFNNHILKQAMALAFIFFITEIYIKATGEINRILCSENHSSYEYTLLSKQNLDTITFIKSISQYTFFYNKEEEKILVIPNSQIEKITQKITQKSFLGKQK